MFRFLLLVDRGYKILITDSYWHLDKDNLVYKSLFRIFKCVKNLQCAETLASDIFQSLYLW